VARGVVASRAKPIRTAPPVGCCAKRSIRGAGRGSWAGVKLTGAQAQGVRLRAFVGLDPRLRRKLLNKMKTI